MDNDPEYKNYVNDDTKTNIDIALFDEYNWGYIDINVYVDYKKEYYIHIKHENNGYNKIDLIIDLQHNAIIDKVNKLRNDDIGTNTKNITYILDNITPILIKYNHDSSTLISLSIYDNSSHSTILDSLNVGGTYIRSIISLLIMILTLKNDVSKDVYKKYNTTFLLSGIYKYQLLKNISIIDYYYCFRLFGGNNYHILTYSNKDHIMDYGGDCALNSLMCVKNEDIRKLFVDKISYSQKNKKLNINEGNNYITKINNILNQMNNYQLKKFNLISSIRNYVNEYDNFISSLINDYPLLKKGIETINYTVLPEEYKDCFTKMYNRYLKFAHILRNNLLDYNLSNDEADEMCDSISNDLIEVDKILNSEVQSGTYDFTSGACKFITIIDRHLKYKDSFYIFYINILISLLLIQHKIDYLFDEDIINVLKHSNKLNIIRCFKNVECNRNELGSILPVYQQGYGNDKYIFKYGALQNITHVVIYIIDVNTPTKKIYLYDLNDLIMHYSEDFNPNNYQELPNDPQQYYSFDNHPPRWIKNKNKYYEKYYSSNIITYFENINRISFLFCSSYSFKQAIIDSLSLNKNSVFRNDGYLDFVTLLTLNDAYYNKNNFNYEYNIKAQIFDKLVNLPNTITSKININFLNVIKYISDFVQKNIIDEESCGSKKLLFKFIECLIKAKWIYNGNNINTINLDSEYKKIKNYFDDTYHLTDTQIFVDYLDFKVDYYRYNLQCKNIIIEILETLIFNFNSEAIVYGGYLNTYFNNSILKRVLIVLLIVVIIIIIVLIILFIINGYNNNLK